MVAKLLVRNGKLFVRRGKLMVSRHGVNCCCATCCCEKMYNKAYFNILMRMGCIVGDPCFHSTKELTITGGSGYWSGFLTEWDCINPQSQLPIKVEMSCGPVPEMDPRPAKPQCNHPFGTKFWIRTTPNGQEGMTEWSAVNLQPPGVADCVGDAFFSRWGNLDDFPTGCTLSLGNVQQLEATHP